MFEPDVDTDTARYTRWRDVRTYIIIIHSMYKRIVDNFQLSWSNRISPFSAEPLYLPTMTSRESLGRELQYMCSSLRRILRIQPETGRDYFYFLFPVSDLSTNPTQFLFLILKRKIMTFVNFPQSASTYVYTVEEKNRIANLMHATESFRAETRIILFQCSGKMWRKT